MPFAVFDPIEQLRRPRPNLCSFLMVAMHGQAARSCGQIRAANAPCDD